MSTLFGMPTLFVTIAADEIRKKWVISFRKRCQDDCTNLFDYC